MEATALILYSSTGGPPHQQPNQEKVIHWMETKKVRHAMVEAVQDKDERVKLTEISGVKGGYPQVFIKREETDIEYIGQFEYLESLIENEGTEFPDVKSFSKVFQDCMLEG